MNLHDHDIRYEAHAEGRVEGLAEGARIKAVEDALMLINDFKATPEIAAQKTKAPLELVLEALKKKV